MQIVQSAPLNSAVLAEANFESLAVLSHLETDFIRKAIALRRAILLKIALYIALDNPVRARNFVA